MSQAPMGPWGQPTRGVGLTGFLGRPALTTKEFKMTNAELATLIAALTAQMTTIAAAVLPPPPVVQSEQARNWLPNIRVVVGTLRVVDIFNNRDDAFAMRASLAEMDDAHVYRVLQECRDDSGVACSAVVARPRDAAIA